MVWLAKVFITLKPVVNDPQGLAIQGGLHDLGFRVVRRVRAGKYLEINLDAPNREAAEQALEEMCRKLLANPVIEDFRFEIQSLP